MISKELLSEVLEKELKRHDSAFVEVTDIGTSNNMMHINYKNSRGIICLFIINIYELAHKCKEWAYKNKYDIWSITWGSVEFLCTETYKGTERIDADTEPEAIFKACEWILDNETNN